MNSRYLFRAAGCLLLGWGMAASPALAQRSNLLPPPLNLSGALTAGFYHAESQNGFSATQDTLLTSVRLDLSGYFHHPKFLTFDVKPQFSLGRPSSEGIFPDGQGLSATATFLGGNSFPLTVSYTRLSRQVITFGTLDRLAGLAADSSQSALTVNWRVRLRRLPQVSVSYSRYRDEYEPLAAITSQFENRSRVFSLDIHDVRLGWQLDSQFRLEKSFTDLLDFTSGVRTPFRMSRDLREFRLSAARDFTSAFRLSFLGGHTKSDNEVAQRPFDQDYLYLYGNAHWKKGSKLGGSIRGGVTRNLLGFQLSAPPGTSPSSSLLVNTSEARVNLLTVAGQVHYALSRDFRLDAQFSHDSTWAPPLATPATFRSRLSAGEGGFSYTRGFRSFQVQARYALNVGQLHFRDFAPSRTWGHHANASVSLWSVLGFEVTASVQALLQATRDSFRIESRNLASDISATRHFASGWRMRASYGFDQNAFDTRGTRFQSNGHGFSFLLGHPKVELSYTRQLRAGLSFNPDLRRGIVPAGQAQTMLAAFPNLQAVPSSTGWMSAVALLRPFRKMTARFWWMRNSQDTSGQTTNRYAQWEATAGYQFRRLNLDFGYVHYGQEFGVTEIARNRFFFRVVREFRVF